MTAAQTPRVAYFCMEFGLSAKLPIYSGGLGVLAGDAIKAVGDAGLPLVGIGLLWSQGYTRQTLTATGQVQDAYPPTPRDALEPIDVRFTIEIAGKPVECTAFRVTDYTRGGELLLIEPVNEADRVITARLYGGGAKDRVAQEMLLGIGGVRLLRALGREVDVYHFNEGHAVFAGFELLREQVETGLLASDALASVRQSVVFTTHTPVPAGNEQHPVELLTTMGAFAGIDVETAVELGGSPFSMTVAGLRMARNANGVAELHGETANEMWKGVTNAAPIIAITNGVHRPTWQSENVATAASGDDDALLAAHQAEKNELIAEIARRDDTRFDPERPIIGFARRAATYKRADLILRNEADLERILSAGVQLVFAGKAHPRDTQGKKVVARVAEVARNTPQIAFLEDYDMVLGALLTRGCDIWLNNPRRPQEACGTSGMKAAMNGVLNLSILDGWWPEGCVHGENGWKIDAGELADESKRDERDRQTLVSLILDDVVPAFADRPRWASMMRASIAMSQEQFSAARMMRDYYSKLY